MPKFFNKSRMKSLKKSKFLRYFFYAIGEILLVVIGILIALEVDNYNKEKELKLEEVEILEEILENLEYDLVDLKDNESSYLNFTPKYKKMLNHLQLGLPQNNEIDTHFMYFSTHDLSLVLTTSGYNSAQLTGFNIFSNKQIKKDIKDLYSFWYPYLLTLERGDRKKFSYYDNFFSYSAKYIKRVEKDFYIINYDKLLHDNEALTIIDRSVFAFSYIGTQYTEVIIKVENLITKLKSEIKTLKKASQF